MTLRRKLAFGFFAIVGSLLLVAIFLAPILLNADHYRPQVISFFEENTGKKVEIQRLALTMFPQVTLHIDGFAIKSPPLFPKTDIFKVSHADAVLDFWALLHRNVIIKSVVLESPDINLISDPDGPWNFENPQSDNSKNTFPLGIIDSVIIKHGHLIASNLLPSDAPGPVFLEAHDISSEMEKVDLAAIANPASPALNGQGTWHAARLRFGSVDLTAVNSRFRLQSREVFFTKLSADAYTGKATGDFSVSLAKKTSSFKADARISAINMAHLLAAFNETRGVMTGKLEGDLKLAGDIEHTMNPLAAMRGTGHIKITNGAVPSLMLNSNLMKLAHFNDLGPAKDNPASFSSISTDLELSHLQISSKSIDIDGYGVDVDGSGNISLAGSNELSYQGIAAITTNQGFLTNTFARFEGAKVKDGKISFPFRIEGTLENPKFSKGSSPK